MASLSIKIEHENDLFQTPEYISEAVRSLIPEGTKNVVDPCVGQGSLVDEDKYEYQCFDLVKYPKQPKNTVIKSFFEVTDKDIKKDSVIVMNPPFSLGRQFIEHALNLVDTVVVICPFSNVKPFKRYIEDFKGEYDWANAFGITFPVGAFLLKRKAFKFGQVTNKFDYLFSQEASNKIYQLPLFKGTEKYALVFRATLLGTYHNFGWIDERTGYEMWCSPITPETSEEVRNYLRFYPSNCRGHKKGDIRENSYTITFDTEEELWNAYGYYIKEFRDKYWYKMCGITSDTKVPVIRNTDFIYTKEEADKRSEELLSKQHERQNLADKANNSIKRDIELSRGEE